MEEIRIPSSEEIIALYHEFHAPKHVRKHCGMVEFVALKLAGMFEEKGIEVNKPLIKAAALLHDFMRVVDFRKFEPDSFPFKPTEEDIAMWKSLREKYKGAHHADAGADILEKRGFPELAVVIRRHKFAQIKDGLSTWEEKILYYADKRVKHDKVVTLRERLDDGRMRNAPHLKNDGESMGLDQKVFDLEREIIKTLGLSGPPVFPIGAPD